MIEASRIGFASAYAAVFLVALFGNCFVIHTARKRRRNKSPFNILIINMAASDIVYAIAIVPEKIFDYELLAWRPWDAGEFSKFLCKTQAFATYVAVTASVLSLTLMALDRYLAIVRQKPMSRKAVKIVVFITWLISIAFGSTQLYSMRIIYRGKANECFPVWSEDFSTRMKIVKIEFNVLFVLDFALPAITMIVLYTKIIRFLWLRKIPGARSVSNERVVSRQKRKVVLMLLTMVLVFIATWLSLYVLHYLMMYNSKKYTSLVPKPFELFVFWIAHANCALNPCLYPIFQKDYQDELCSILRKTFTPCRCRRFAVFPTWRKSLFNRKSLYFDHRFHSESTVFHDGVQNRAFSVWGSHTAITTLSNSNSHQVGNMNEQNTKL